MTKTRRLNRQKAQMRKALITLGLTFLSALAFWLEGVHPTAPAGACLEVSTGAHAPGERLSGDSPLIRCFSSVGGQR
jgi:hypothetical protein